MKILWTKSHAPLSVLIRKVTREPVSHVALSYYGLIIQANLKGVNIIEESRFRESCEVVFEKELNWTPEEQLKLHSMLKKHQGSWYDVGALLFTGFSLLLRHYFKLPLPKSNLWQSSGMFICTEWVTALIDEKADSMITPYGLYLKLRDL